MRSIGINEFLNKKFDTYGVQGKWLDHFGEPETNFKMIVYGHSGNGKTEYCLQLAKYLASFTKVYFNSFEQGISKTLQDGIKRNNMKEVAGKVIFGNKETVAEMIARLKKKNSPRIIIIDSRDYINLTAEQFKMLIEAFPRKAFIVLCWESAGKPKGEYAKAIEFMCDIKVNVRHFKAYPRSRFGGNQTYLIWDRKPAVGDQLKLLTT
jgi:hypothetical protein